MADNITIKDSTSTDRQVATDEIAGIHYERNKLSIGDDGSAVDASLLAPVPVAYGAQKVSDFLEVAINCAASGDNTIVTGTASQSVRVYAFFFVVSAAVNVKWKDGAGTDFHPALPFTVAGAWDKDPMGRPWFTTQPGNALVLNLSAAVQVSGRLYYTKST